MTIVELMGLLVKAGAVFGLLAITVRMLRRLDGGKGGRRGRRRGGRLAALAGAKGARKRTTMDIVERKALGRSSAVVLLRVRDQHWVVGVTEQQVQVLLEVDVEGDEEPVVDLRAGTGPARAPGWGDLGRLLAKRVPLLRTSRTDVDEVGAQELSELDAAVLSELDAAARPFQDALDDALQEPVDDEGHAAGAGRARAIGRAQR